MSREEYNELLAWSARSRRTRSRLAGSVFQPASGRWSPAEKLPDPIRVFPAVSVEVARKPPTTGALKANQMGRASGAAADAAVLACGSFDCWRTSPLIMDCKVR